MKYVYAYKTSDGARHEASMEAVSREEVFAALRKDGIKAIKVVAADGSKANGEVRGIRKRVAALGALALTLCAIVAIVVAFRAGESSSGEQGEKGEGQGTTFLTDRTRRQVIGDAAVIEKGIKTGWSDVFDNEGDRFLASFAIPGVKAGVGTTSVEALKDVLKEGAAPVKSPRGIEARQIAAMVEGMKDEARRYLKAGGSLVEYGKRLTERQDAEIAVYKRVENEIQAAQKTLPETEFMSFLEQRNDELRNLGIRPIVLSD